MCSSEGPPPGAGPKRLKSRPRMANTMVKTMLADKTPRHVPPGFNPVTLYLTVDDPDRLVAFAKAAFGAEELKDQRATGPDGKTMHTAFSVETCIIETGPASGQWKALAAGVPPYLRDRDETHAPAVQNRGGSLPHVRDMEYGE